MSISPTSGNTTPATGGTSGTDYVTITQPDGSKYRVPQTKASWDPETKTWVSNVTPEAIALANQINRKHGMSLDADDFMGLLVAQLRYQDPSKPADTAAMMQQTGTMSMVERINEMASSAEAMVKASEKLAESNDKLTANYATSLMEQRMASSVALVGRSVTYASATDPNTKLEGRVESVRFDETGPILSVDGKDVPLSAVASVKGDTTTTAPAPKTETAPTKTDPAPAA